MNNYKNQSDILQLILEHIEANRALLSIPDKQMIDKTTLLFGEKGILDSLQLIHFLISLEKFIARKVSKKIVLASPRFFSTNNSPVRTPETIAQFILEDLDI